MMIDTTIRRIMKPNQPGWLTSLQNDLALITAQDASRMRPAHEAGGPVLNFRLEHVQQVERDVLRLNEQIHADEDILLAAVWIHDRFKSQFEGETHTAKAAAWAREHLAELGFPAEKVDLAAYAIARHADEPGTIPANAVEARMLWDADKLVRIGPLNIISYLYTHPAYPQQRITYTSIALLGLEQLERSHQMIDQLYLEASREIASQRYEEQEAFYRAFARDINAQ